jgi:hypothetical protein
MPAALPNWIKKGKYTPLESPRTIAYRTKAQQQPESKKDVALVKAVYD